MVNKIWDKIGICASGLCLVHCLATPVLLLLLPALNLSDEKHGHMHEIFAVVVVLSIMLAVFPNCRKHGHYDIMAIASIGIALILSAVFFHDMPFWIAQVMTVAGSIFLITAHIKNMKVRHGKCEDKHKSTCTSKH